MFKHQPFYNQHIKNVVSAFGTLFNDIQFIRAATATHPAQTVNVPLTYASKDKAFIRRTQDNDLNFNMRMQYPRLAFQMVGIEYDPTRKINQQPALSKAGIDTRIFHPAPYNIEFELYVATANIEDGLQIIEQILPYFNPEYTISINHYTSLNLIKDVPVVLNAVTPLDNTPDSEFEDVRVLEWTLSFTAKAWIGGPQDTTGKRIKDVKLFVFGNDINATVPDSTVDVQVTPLTASSTEPHTITSNITES